MENTLTYLLLCLLLATTSYAKKEIQFPAANTRIQFVENKGQITDQHGAVRRDIDVKIEANGVTMFVGNGEIHYQWVAAQSQNSKVKSPKNLQSEIENHKSDIELYRMDVKLLGANKNAQVVFEEPTGYYENYYLAHTGEDGVTARGYERITYKNIYPNIDLVLYTPPAPLKGSDNASMSGASEPTPTPPERGSYNASSPLGEIEGQTSRGIKYDFIIHPSGNPADIKLRYEGATALKLVDGALVAETTFGTITEEAPYSYSAETKEPITSAYKLSANTLSFDIGSYNGTLIIDPTLLWGTYYGGLVDDRGLSVAVDIYENVYICGSTASANNIATTGTHQSSLSGSTVDGFVAKLDSSGQRIWGSYYGTASGQEIMSSISCDKNGYIYVAGICDSTAAQNGAIATSGGHQTAYGGYDDAFLVKLNGSNGQRVWATLYGGNGSELSVITVCDNTGSIYLGGTTWSSNSVLSTSGTHKPNANTLGGTEGFVTKFSSNGSRIWGTYYGGDTAISGPATSYDIICALACDKQGNIYAGGYTSSKDNIAATGAYQVTPGDNEEGFLVKLSGANGQRIWGTYYGGNDFDAVKYITVENDVLYVGGGTRSTTGIASTGAYKTFKSGFYDAFLAAFSTAGARQWGTYYGGSGDELVSSLAISPGGRLYVSGQTSSTSGIATGGAHQASFGGSTDIFLSEFTPAGQFEWGSYYGGSNGEDYPGTDNSLHYFTHTVSVSNEGRLYLAGRTFSSNNIATTGSHQSSFGSSSSSAADAFLAAFETDTIVYIPQRYTDTVWCPGDTVRIVYGVNRPFLSGNDFTVQLSNATGSFAAPVNIGTKAAINKDTITCVIPMSTPAGTGYRIRITADNPGRVSWDNQWDIRINPLPANLVAGSNSPVCTGDSLQLTGSSSNSGITWIWSGPNSFSSSAKDSFITNAQLIDSGKYILKATLNSTGCSLTDTTTVEMRPTPDKPTAGSNSPVCEFYSVQLTTSSSTSGVSYSWIGPGSYSSITQNPTVTTSATSTHAGDYISTVTLNGCNNKDTTTVIVLPKPAKPTAGATNSPLCQRQDLQLTASAVTGASYTWYGPSAFTANVQNPVRAYVQLADAGAYYVYATVSGCVSDTDSVVVTVNTDPFVNIFPTPGATICPGQQVTFTAIPTNGGTSPVYEWRKNGIATGSTGVTYTTNTLNNGDVVSCLMTSSGTCATPFTDTSNAITMTVLPTKAPKVSITADAGPSLFPNEPINFTATYSDAGADPTFQWKRSGKDVQGATGSIWGANGNFLSNGDEICVVIYSNYECPDPDTALSNCIKLEIRVGVDDVVNDNNIKIYPNPAKGVITITSTERIEKVEISNLLGQKMLTRNGNSGTMQIDMSVLAAGIYIIRVNDGCISRLVKE